MIALRCTVQEGQRLGAESDVLFSSNTVRGPLETIFPVNKPFLIPTII